MAVTGGYWRLLAITGGYRPSLAATGGYLQLLAVTGGYWRLPICASMSTHAARCEGRDEAKGDDGVAPFQTRRAAA